MTEETVGIDCQTACLVDGPSDDYESWRGPLHKDEATLYVHYSGVSQGGRCLTHRLGGTRPKPLPLSATK